MNTSDNTHSGSINPENGYLSLIFQNTSDLFCLIKVGKDNELIILSINPSYLAAAKAYNPNVTSEAFIGKSMIEVMDREYDMRNEKAAEVLKKYAEVLKTRRPNAFIEKIDFGGLKRYYTSEITPIIDNKGVCTHLLYAAKDITEKEDYELRLKSREKKFRALIENAYEGIVIYDENGFVTYASPSLENIVGYTEDDILGQHGNHFIHPDDVDAATETFRKIRDKEGSNISCRFRIRHINGHYLWLEATLSNLLSNSEVKGVISNFRDITSQKLAEDQLTETNQLLENINHNIKEGIYRTVPAGKFMYVNHAFLKMFGFESLEDLNTVSSSQLYASISTKEEVHQELFKNKIINNLEVRFKKKDGSEFWGLISSALIKGENDEKYFDGAVRDITKQKAAEAHSRLNEQLLTSISQNITEGIFRTSIKGGIIFANHAFIDIFGYDSIEEVMELDPTELYADKESRDSIRKLIAQHGAVRNNEVKLKKKNGEIFWGLYSSSHSKGTEGQDIFDGAVRDITEIKIAEQQLTELNEELQKQNQVLSSREEELNLALRELSDRNFELDQLVYKTSHDLRSPLTSILGLVNIAKIDKEPSHQEEYLNRVEKSILKLDEFVRSMLNYAKASRSEVKLVPFDLRKLLENCISDLEYLENFKKVTTTLDIEDNGNSFSSDPLRLKIIFDNIISNAYKYIKPEGEASFLKIKATFNSMGLTIIFEDNGIGIEESQIDKVFDMFYRATEISEGSGLGMYIVKQAIVKLGGTVTVESKESKGTKFTILLPNIEQLNA